MRVPVLIFLVAACGNDVGMEPDAVAPTPPRVIAGGGIGDGPIDGVVNLHVIDDATRMPVANATVRVGTVDGVTDANGLFVADGLVGPQTIAVKAPGYRAEVWVGANGTNVTVNLEQANSATPPSGTINGSINLASLAVPAGHVKLAIASYSQTTELGDPANEIAQPNNQNLCFGDTCSFKLASRTGKVAVIAAVFDHDTKGTQDPDDDTQVLLGWAVKTGLVVTANGTHDATLALIPASQLQDVTVGFGTPPSALSQVGSIVGIETPDGTLPLLPMFQTPASPTVRAPRPDAIASGATYQLTAIASATTRQSVVLRRGQAGPSLAAGTWLAPPSGSATRTGGSWTAAAGATVHALEYSQGATRIANVTVLDGSTSVTLPDLVAVPSGSLTVGIQAIGAPGLDVTNFSLDADRDKLTMVGGQQVELN